MPNHSPDSFLKIATHPLRYRWFTFLQLPSAFFSGVRVAEANAKECVTTVKYKWFSKNPFRSTYFACLSMAAEMSSGILAMAHAYKRQPTVSMLVVRMEAHYHKKAVGRTNFICEDGDVIQMCIEKAITTQEGQIATVQFIVIIIAVFSLKTKSTLFVFDRLTNS
jgi:phage terminase large subunit-like protein